MRKIVERYSISLYWLCTNCRSCKNTKKSKCFKLNSKGGYNFYLFFSAKPKNLIRFFQTFYVDFSASLEMTKGVRHEVIIRKACFSPPSSYKSYTIQKSLFSPKIP